MRRPAPHLAEVAHWNQIEAQARTGDRMFWLNHPRGANPDHEKALVDGLRWQEWISKALGRPAEVALELGCGQGDGLVSVWRAGIARRLVGVDLDEARFAVARARLKDAGENVQFRAEDI